MEGYGLSDMMTAQIMRSTCFLNNGTMHASWLRIYAIKLEPGIYIITGGAIKLTRTMQEREHTIQELAKMEKVRSHLLTNNIVDKDSFVDFIGELV